MMTRETSWSNIGTNVSEAKDMNSVLKLSGLDFKVEKRPLFVQNENAFTKYPFNAVATVNASTNEPLGIVSDNYQIVDNVDGFDFVDNLAENLQFCKAGMTASGMVYVIAKMADKDILHDKYTPYIILQNSFNGAYGLRVAIVPLRIVCQNQFRLAFKEATNTVTIRHSGDINTKISMAHEVLTSSDAYFKMLGTTIEQMALKKVSDTQVSKIIEAVYPIASDAKVNAIEKIELKRAEFLNAYNAEDNQNFRGSLYGLVNAASDIDTHSEPSRKSDNWEERRFIYLSGSTGIIVPRVIDAAQAIAA